MLFKRIPVALESDHDSRCRSQLCTRFEAQEYWLRIVRIAAFLRLQWSSLFLSLIILIITGSSGGLSKVRSMDEFSERRSARRRPIGHRSKSFSQIIAINNKQVCSPKICYLRRKIIIVRKFIHAVQNICLRTQQRTFCVLIFLAQ